MELLALVIFNLVLGFVFYFVIQIKINETLKEFQTQKLKKEIQTQILQFYKESENYLVLMDAKISALKNLLDRAEKLGINFATLESNLKQTKEHKEENEITPKTTKPSKIAVKTNSSKQFESIQLVENSGVGFLSSVGKAFRSVLGISENLSKNSFSETKLNKSVSKVIPKNRIDFSIDGNPFEDVQTPKINNHNPTGEFYSLLNDTNSRTQIKDEAKISIQAAIKELPQNSTKVEKVIFLLKKGYTHTEISEELGLALPEIALIETIHVEKSKRF